MLLLLCVLLPMLLFVSICVMVMRIVVISVVSPFWLLMMLSCSVTCLVHTLFPGIYCVVLYDGCIASECCGWCYCFLS